MGEELPAGVGVGCTIYALHHNEDYIPDPFSYKPERWINGEAATEAVSIHAPVSNMYLMAADPGALILSGDSAMCPRP